MPRRLRQFETNRLSTRGQICALTGAAGAREQSVTRHFLIPLVAASLAACGGGDAKQGGGARQTPLVKVEAATPVEFADRIEAIGTARANEQVTLAAPVTERIVRLNFDDGAFVRQGQVVAVLRQAEQNAQL